jgi:hypothetical protein
MKVNRLNKKAIMFSLLLILLIGFPALYTIYGSFKGKQKLFEGATGDSQVMLLNVYGEGEKQLLFLDYAAKYALYQSVHETARRGGFVSDPGCGSIEGYVLYMDGGRSCMFEHLYMVTDTVKLLFHSYLMEYFEKLSLPDFDYAVTGDIGLTLEGTPRGSLNLTFKNGVYSVHPSFSAQVDYDMGIYGALIAQVKELNQTCYGVGDEALYACVERLKPPGSAVMQKGARTFVFDVSSGAPMPYFDGAAKSVQPVVIRFGVRLE